MIINIRGTSGSGKSTAVYDILKKYPSHPLMKDGKIFAHRIDLKYNKFLFAIGPYQSSCAGCDRMPSQDSVCDAIRALAPHGDVLFEGFFVSGISKRYIELARSLKSHKFVFAFMDTPLKLSLKRLRKRRLETGVTKPLKPHYVIDKHNVLLKMKENMEKEGLDVRTLPHKKSANTILKWIEEPRRFPRLPRFPRLLFPRLLSRLVINVRGTNGSGKSRIMFDLMEKYGKIPLKGSDGKTWAYKLKSVRPIYILGRYDTPTGGCDTIRDMEQICDGVRKLVTMGDVLFEGLLISGMYGRWVALAKSIQTDKFIFAVLDTPLKKCIKRTIRRRRARGNMKPFDPKNLIAKNKAVLSSTKALKSCGMDVRTLSYKLTIPTIEKWIKERGKRDGERSSSGQ